MHIYIYQGLNSWQQRGATIPMPARINTGYRDPVRAFEVGIVCAASAISPKNVYIWGSAIVVCSFV